MTHTDLFILVEKAILGLMGNDFIAVMAEAAPC
jgi:hypothetical protein